MREELKLVVTIPAWNEEATIGDVIRGIPRNIDGICCVEIVVIDDGSTDQTASVAREGGAAVVSFGVHRGLGAAFAEGFRSALARGADLIVNIDADGQFDPGDISLLLKPILEGNAELVTASRFLKREFVPEMPRIKKWGNRRVATIVNLISGLKLADVSCGFRAYSRDAALRATLLEGHTYTQEVILELAFRGMRIVEVPVKVRGVREVGKSRVAGSVWKYGWKSLLIMLGAFRDYRPMRFFGSISLGFALLALLCGGFVVGHYLLTGAFSPYIFIGFLAGGCGVVSLVAYITALLAGMINRLRILSDEQLFILRRQEYIQRASDPERLRK